MNFKNLTIVIVLFSFALACQQDSGKENTSTESEVSEQQDQTPQAQQNTDPLQANQQAEAISDEELRQFVNVSQKLQAINQEAQQSMVQAVQESGLDVQRYSEIQQAMQDPEKEANPSEKEKEQFSTAFNQFQKIQVDAQKQMQEMLKTEGLTQNRFQEISTSLQSDPELQQKIEALQQQAQ